MTDDRHLADGELGYWRECYRDQLARANTAEAEVVRLRGLLTLWLNMAPADVREIALNGSTLGDLTRLAFDEDRP